MLPKHLQITTITTIPFIPVLVETTDSLTKQGRCGKRVALNNICTLDKGSSRMEKTA
jgi:hypothetical protein